MTVSLATLERSGTLISDLPAPEREAFEREQAAICEGLRRTAAWCVVCRVPACECICATERLTRRERDRTP